MAALDAFRGELRAGLAAVPADLRPEDAAPDAWLYEPGRAEHMVQKSFLAARAANIASGTSEIMRGIIAMQVLGLPRGT